MKLILSEKKTTLLAPVFIVLLVFFIPISSSIKSILVIPSLFMLVFTPYYRRYLSFTFNTLWARAALALFLYVIIASLWSEAPSSLRYITIDKYSKLIFLPIWAVAFIRPQTRKWALNSFIFAMLVTCVLSLLKSHHLVIFNSEDPGEVFYNHIVTGFMIALALYFSGILFLNKDTSRTMRYFYLFMLVLGSYQMFFVNTGRTGYIAYGILMSLLIVQKLPIKKALLGVMLFVGSLTLIYILSPVMQNQTNLMVNDIRLLHQNQANTSLGYRIQFHKYAQSLFAEHPIVGIGTGGFPYRFSKDLPLPSWGTKLNEPHGQYWLTLAEQGLIGIILLLFFLGTLFVTALQLKETRLILFGTLISFCILSFSDTIFCYSPMGYLLIFFSALCFGELIERNNLKISPNKSTC